MQNSKSNSKVITSSAFLAIVIWVFREQDSVVLFFSQKAKSKSKKKL
jgi:hypothetical protein